LKLLDEDNWPYVIVTGWGFINGLTDGLTDNMLQCFKNVVLQDKPKKEEEEDKPFKELSDIGKFKKIMKIPLLVKDGVCLITNFLSDLDEIPKTLLSIADFVNSFAETLLTDSWEYIDEVVEAAKGAKSDLKELLKALAEKIEEGLKEKAPKLLKKIKDAQNFYIKVKGVVTNSLNKKKEKIQKFFEKQKDEIKKKFQESKKAVKDFLKRVLDKMKINGEKSFKKLEGIVNGVNEFFCPGFTDFYDCQKNCCSAFLEGVLTSEYTDYHGKR